MINDLVNLCSVCGKVILEDKEEPLCINGEYYCEHCKAELAVCCEDCGQWVLTEDSVLTESDTVCTDCIRHNYTKCSKCNKYFRNLDMTEVDGGELVCEDCLEDYFYCEHCCIYYPLESEHYCVSNYGLVCGECIEDDDRFPRCCECGATYHVNDMENSHGNWYCQDCYEQRSEGVISEYHDHHEDDPVFFGDNKDNSVPYLGVELEVDSGNYSSDSEKCATKILSIFSNDFIYMETDGSLDDGFENITQPATYEYHLSIKEQYELMFKTIVHNGFRSHDTSTCGLHVHFNRSYFKENATSAEYDLCITRLLYLVEKFWDQLVTFSRRNIYDLTRWSQKYNENPEEIVEGMKNNRYSRYYAVNLTNRDTIEFRMFKGTLNINTFLATLELCHTLITTAKNTSDIQAIQALSWEDLLVTPNIKSYWERIKNRRVV